MTAHPSALASALLAGAMAMACSQPTPEDAAVARAGVEERAEAMPDTIADLIQARVPPAAAGDSGWAYQQRVSVNLDDDSEDETVVLISDVSVGAGGQPLWEDGHRWQVYVREADGRSTRLYARFLPNGRLTAHVVAPETGTTSWIVLFEETPDRLAVYEFRYRGPNSVQVYRRLERRRDPMRQLTGAIR